jgi:hypothetical protein
MASPGLRRPGGPAGSSAAERILPAGIGLLIAGTLALFDALVTPGSVVIGTVVLAPFVVSVLGGPRETALVGAVATAIALVSAAWNGNFVDAAYVLRVVVVVVGGAVAVLASSGRERTARDRARFALLSAVAEVADGRLTLEETAAHLSELIVPGFADVAILDVLREGSLRRLSVRARGPHAQEREVWVGRREPSPATGSARGEDDPRAPGGGRLLANSRIRPPRCSEPERSRRPTASAYARWA